MTKRLHKVTAGITAIAVVFALTGYVPVQNNKYTVKNFTITSNAAEPSGEAQTYNGWTVRVLAENDDAVGLRLEGYSGTDTEITIPSSMKVVWGSKKNVELPIIEMTDFLRDNSTVTAITFQSDSMCYGVCVGMSALKTVTFADGVTEISDSAFEACHALESIKFSDSVKTIWDNAFEDCDSLKKLELGKGIEKIGIKAFSGVPLEEVKWNGSIKEIGGRAFSVGDFEENPFSVKSLVLPDSLEIIGNCAFKNCKSLTSVTLGKNTKTIGAGAFDLCGNLKKLSLNEKLENIMEYAFTNTGLMSKVTLPDTVKEIGDYAFYGTAITGVDFSCTLESIGEAAFEGTRITSVILPDSVTSLGIRAFCGCPITELKLSNSLEIIPENCFRGLQAAVIDIPDSVKIIDTCAFCHDQNLKSLNFGNSLEIIGDDAFNGEGGSLEYIEFPDSVKEIGFQAFYRQNLKQIKNFPKSLEKMGTRVFVGCENLTDVAPFPASVGEVPDEMFMDCISLKNITFEDGVTAIGKNAFRNTGITEITLPDSVTEIKEGAFNSSALANANIGNGIEFIGAEAFENTYLKEITIPDSVIGIGENSIGYSGGGWEHKTVENFKIITNNDEAVSYAKANKIEYSDKGTAKKEYIDKATGIHVIAQDGYIMKIEKVTDIERMDEITGDNISMADLNNEITANNGEIAFGYNILFYENDDDILPTELDDGYTVMFPESQLPKNTNRIAVRTNLKNRGLRDWQLDTSIVSTKFSDGYLVFNDYNALHDTSEENELFIVESYYSGFKGDINGSGTFDIADVVTLQRWLLGVPNTNLVSWEAGNFCEDDVLDIYDFCLMKMALIDSNNQ